MSSTDGHLGLVGPFALLQYTIWAQETIHSLRMYLPRFPFWGTTELKVADVFDDLFTIC